MKLTSLINVTRAAAGGSNCSSLRAAYKPPNPPPRIRTLQAMPRACSAGDRGERGPPRQPPSLPHHTVPANRADRPGALRWVGGGAGAKRGGSRGPRVPRRVHLGGGGATAAVADVLDRFSCGRNARAGSAADGAPLRPRLRV